LKVNIRGAQLESFNDQGVDQLDDGSFRIHVFGGIHGRSHAGNLDLALRDVLNHFIDCAFRSRTAAAPAAAAATVILVERGLDVLLDRNLQFDLGAEQVGQAVDGIQIRRVADRHGDDIAVFGNGHRAEFLCDVAADERNDIVTEAQFAEVYNFSTEVGGLGLRD